MERRATAGVREASGRAAEVGIQDDEGRTDNTCPHCRFGYQTSCQHRTPVIGAQAPVLRVPLADGTSVATRERAGACDLALNVQAGAGPDAGSVAAR